jgi:hypothetical protein
VTLPCSSRYAEVQNRRFKMCAGVWRPLLSILGVSYPVGVSRPEGLTRPPVYTRKYRAKINPLDPPGERVCMYVLGLRVCVCTQIYRWGETFLSCLLLFLLHLYVFEHVHLHVCGYVFFSIFFLSFCCICMHACEHVHLYVFEYAFWLFTLLLSLSFLIYLWASRTPTG